MLENAHTSETASETSEERNANNVSPEEFAGILKSGGKATTETQSLTLTAAYAAVVDGYVFSIAFRDSGERQIVGAATLGGLYEAMERYASLSEWGIEG